MSSYNRSTRDMKIGVLKKCGEMIDGTSPYEQNGTIIDYINKANLRILAGGNEFINELSKPWPWALETNPIILTLQPAITTLAVGLTAQSTAMTLSSAPVDWNGQQISIAGWYVKLSGYPEYVRVSSHTAGTTSAVIDSAWTDTTVSAVNATIFLLDYTLQDPSSNGIMRLAQNFRVHRPQDLLGDEEYGVYLADEREMLKEFPLALIRCNVPVRFCITGKSPSGVTVRFNSYPQYATRAEIRFIRNPVPLTDTPGRPFNATLTIASPGVFTGPVQDPESGYAGFNLSNGDTFTLATTGALPTGLVAGTTYYCVGSSGNTFKAAATSGGTAINTSGSQSGVITVTPTQAQSYPLIPIEFQELLEYIASHWVSTDKGYSDKAQEMMMMAKAMGQALIDATQKEKIQTAKMRGRLVPRQDTFVRGKRIAVQEVTQD